MSIPDSTAAAGADREARLIPAGQPSKSLGRSPFNSAAHLLRSSPSASSSASTTPLVARAFKPAKPKEKVVSTARAALPTAPSAAVRSTVQKSTANSGLAQRKQALKTAAAGLAASSAKKPLSSLSDQFTNVFMTDRLVFKPGIEEALRAQVVGQLAELIDMPHLVPLSTTHTITVEKPCLHGVDEKLNVNKGIKYECIENIEENDEAIAVRPKKIKDPFDQEITVLVDEDNKKRQFIRKADGTWELYDPTSDPTFFTCSTPTNNNEEDSDDDGTREGLTKPVEKHMILVVDEEGDFYLIPKDMAKSFKQEEVGLVQERVANIFQGPDPKKPLNLLDPSSAREAFYERISQNDFGDAFLAMMLLRPQDGKVSNLGEDTNVLFQLKDPANPSSQLQPVIIDLGETLPERGDHSTEPPAPLNKNKITYFPGRSQDKNINTQVVGIQNGLMGFPHAHKKMTAAELAYIKKKMTDLMKKRATIAAELSKCSNAAFDKNKHLPALLEIIDKMEAFLTSHADKKFTLADLFFYTFPAYKKQWDEYDKLEKGIKGVSAWQVGIERRAKQIGLYSMDQVNIELSQRAKGSVPLADWLKPVTNIDNV